MPDTPKQPAHRRQIFILLAILVFAIVIRLAFFSGLVGSDDLAYSKSAHAILQGTYEPQPTPLSNRLGFITLLAGAFRIFGVGETALVLPSFIASLLQIVLAWWFLFRMGKKRAALIAAGFLALLPWDIVLATRGYPDIPSAVCFAAFVVLAWPGGGQSPQPTSVAFDSAQAHGQSQLLPNGPTLIASVLAGACLFFSYFLKEMSAFQMLYFGPFLLFCAWKWRTIRWRCFLAIAVTAGALLLFESLWYLHATGDLLYRFHGVSAGYNQTGWSGIGLYAGGMAKRLLVDAPGALLLDVAYLQGFALALIGFLAVRKSAGTLAPIAGWLLFDLCFFWAGTTSFTSFNPLPLFRRYMLVMAFPAALLLGVWLEALWSSLDGSKQKRGLLIGLLLSCLLLGWGAAATRGGLHLAGALLLALTGLAALFRKQFLARAALIICIISLVVAGLMQAYPVSHRTAGPEKSLYQYAMGQELPLYTDERTLDILNFYDGYQGGERFGNYQTLTEDNLPEMLVAVNESRVSFLMKSYDYQLPFWVKSGGTDSLKHLATLGSGRPGENIYIFRAEPADTSGSDERKTPDSDLTTSPTL